MAIVKVQDVKYDLGFTGGTSSTATFGSALTSGSKLIVWATVGASVTISWSDSAGNTYTPIVQRFWANVGSTVAMAYCDNTSTATPTVTIAHGGASQVLRSGGILEWTGLATGAPEAQTVGNNSVGTTVTDVSMSTTTDGDLIFACVGGEQTLSAGSGFTALDLNTSTTSASEYQIQTTHGSITATFGQSPSGQAVVLSAAFAPSGGGGGPTLPPIIVMPPRRP